LGSCAVDSIRDGCLGIRSTSLDRINRRTESHVVCRSGSPSHSQSSLIASLINTRVDAVWVWRSSGTKHSNNRVFGKRENISLIFQQGNTVSGNILRNRSMVASDIDMLVNPDSRATVGALVCHICILLSPTGEANFRVVLILPKLVPGS